MLTEPTEAPNLLIASAALVAETVIFLRLVFRSCNDLDDDPRFAVLMLILMLGLILLNCLRIFEITGLRLAGPDMFNCAVRLNDAMPIYSFK